MTNPFTGFKKPSSASNPFWTLPPIEQIVDLLRAKAGNVTELLRGVSEEPADQEQLLFLIQDELSKDENAEQAKRWRRYTLLNLRSKLTLGTEQVMATYARGNLDKHQFVKDLGKSIMPELYDPSKYSASKEDKDEEEMQKELDALQNG